MRCFNDVSKKLQNIVQTMHLKMSIAHPYPSVIHIEEEQVEVEYEKSASAPS